MYCYEEMVEGRKLTEIINSTHENVKSAPAASSRGTPHVIYHVTLNRYLPGRLLPENVVAIPDICDAARGPLPCILHAVHQRLKMVCRRDYTGCRHTASIHRQAAASAQKCDCPDVPRHLAHQGICYSFK